MAVADPESTEKFWQLPVAALEQRLGAGPQGLAAGEAAARLKTFGPNKLRAGPHLLTDDLSARSLVRRLERARFGEKARVTLPEGVEMVMPGDNVTMEVNLIVPVAMEEKLRFAIREGGRTVGAGVVSTIIA